MLFSPGSESKAGVSWEAGVAGRDELSLRRRSCRTVGHIRSRIHVSLYKSSPNGETNVKTQTVPVHLEGKQLVDFNKISFTF